jgi:hypothetical protein
MVMLFEDLKKAVVVKSAVRAGVRIILQHVPSMRTREVDRAQLPVGSLRAIRELATVLRVNSQGPGGSRGAFQVKDCFSLERRRELRRVACRLDRKRLGKPGYAVSDFRGKMGE